MPDAEAGNALLLHINADIEAPLVMLHDIRHGKRHVLAAALPAEAFQPGREAARHTAPAAPHGKIHLRLHTRGRKPEDIFQQTDDKMSSFHCDAYGTQLGNLTPVENKIQMQADPQIPRQLKTGCDIPGIAGISRQQPVLFILRFMHE